MNSVKQKPRQSKSKKKDRISEFPEFQKDRISGKVPIATRSWVVFRGVRFSVFSDTKRVPGTSYPRGSGGMLPWKIVES